jgi:hypothetical protein
MIARYLEGLGHVCGIVESTAAALEARYYERHVLSDIHPFSFYSSSEQVHVN